MTPIWCYAIDHPEGLFVVDAGASPSYNDPTSWEPDPRTGAVIRSFIKLDVADGQTLPDQLRSAGLRPDSVRAIVLTHQHIDHTGTEKRGPASPVARPDGPRSTRDCVPMRGRGSCGVKAAELLGEQPVADPHGSVRAFSPKVEGQQLVVEAVGGQPDEGVVFAAAHHPRTPGCCRQ